MTKAKMPQLGDDEVWIGVPNETTVTDDWTVLVLDNGRKILTIGDERQAGSHVSILESDDLEICAWHCAEWEAEGEGETVMGAILRLAGGEQLNDVKR